jgi:lysophospholipase L1-like esterase
MLARLDRDVLAEDPDVVVWQLGTNAALRAQNVAEFRRLLAGGIDRLQGRGIEVILMTPQFAPAFNALQNGHEYVAAIDEIAREKRVALFPRYRIMRDWAENDQMPFANFLTMDGLHLNDFGYACIGQLLAKSIQQALGAERPSTASREAFQYFTEQPYGDVAATLTGFPDIDSVTAARTWFRAFFVSSAFAQRLSSIAPA